MPNAYISGTGFYVPPKVVTNEQLRTEYGIDTSDEWIVQRTGIEQRHFAEEGVSNSDLAVPACKEAIERAGMTIQDIDMIVHCTLSPDHAFPGTGCYIQDKLGFPAAKRFIPAMDVRNQCSGFLYGLATATSMVKAGAFKNILLVGFKTEALKPLTGKSLAEVAKMRGEDPRFVAMDLILEDGTRVGTVYFTQSPENLRKKVALPWVSFCSDAASLAPEGIFLESSTHPRAYGSFARVLGMFARDEALLSLEEAVRKLSALPAANLKIDRRGRLEEGYYADVVVFDPARVQDHATFEQPHQYATGVQHVLVNGVAVLEDGEHTGATPGRVVRGPGAKN